MTSKIAVSARILNWAVHKDPSVKKKFPKFTQWLSGQSQPSLNDLEKLGKATHVPFGFFFLDEPPEIKLPFPHYRTVKDKDIYQPSPNLLDTVRTIELRQGWMSDYLRKQNYDPLPFVGSATVDGEPKLIAAAMKKALGLGPMWASKQPNWTSALDELRERTSQTGIMVVANGIVGNNTKRKLDVNEFRGFVMVDKYAPFVFINNADSKAAQMFTLVHELAHVWVGSSAAFDLKQLKPSGDEVEQACNSIAAEFLVSEQELRVLWQSVKDKDNVYEAVARHFRVSQLVAARRALDLGLIKQRSFFDFYEDYIAKDLTPKKQDGGSFYNLQNMRVGKKFAQVVVTAVREGVLLYRDAYILTGLHGSTFETYAKRL